MGDRSEHIVTLGGGAVDRVVCTPAKGIPVQQARDDPADHIAECAAAGVLHASDPGNVSTAWWAPLPERAHFRER